MLLEVVLATQAGGKCLVCCQGGRHRAPMMLIYLLRLYRPELDYDAAFSLIQGCTFKFLRTKRFENITATYRALTEQRTETSNS